RVPALVVNGETIIIRGKFVKTAAVHDEAWLDRDIRDPELCVEGLKELGRPADFFTFTQRLPSRDPQYSYPVEWDSVAAVRLVGYTQWWDSLPQEARKNVRRSQKRGVEVRVKTFDDDAIRGISDVNNDSPTLQNKANAHYGKTLERLKKDYSAFVDRS